MGSSLPVPVLDDWNNQIEKQRQMRIVCELCWFIHFLDPCFLGRVQNIGRKHSG